MFRTYLSYPLWGKKKKLPRVQQKFGFFLCGLKGFWTWYSMTIGIRNALAHWISVCFTNLKGPCLFCLSTEPEKPCPLWKKFSPRCKRRRRILFELGWKGFWTWYLAASGVQKVLATWFSLRFTIQLGRVFLKVSNHQINFDLISLMRWADLIRNSSRRPTAAGFEPARAEPNGFLAHLHNHSDTLSWWKSAKIRYWNPIFQQKFLFSMSDQR